MTLVTRQIATYREIMTFWDINEVWEAVEHVNIQEDAEWLAHKDAEARMKARH